MASLLPAIETALLSNAPAWRLKYPEYSPVADGWSGASLGVFGSKNNNLPIEENPGVKTGVVNPDYSTIFYNRIHITPSFTDLGNIVNDYSVSVKVWNAYFTPVTIESVDVNNGAGTELIDPIGDYPHVAGGLAEFEYVLNVSASVGDSELDAQINFDFNVGSYQSRVTGSRTVVFPFSMDWAADLEESFQFNTVVTRSITGKEQRMGLNQRPRRKLSFTARSFDVSESSLMRSLLWGWQDRYYAVPLWSDADTLGSSVSEGSITIPIDTEHKNYFVGGAVIIYQSPDSYESATISGVTSNSVTLERELQNDWTASSKVMPLVYGHLPNQASLSNVTDSICEGRMLFAIDPATTSSGVEGGSEDHTHNGLELFVNKPDWSVSLNLDSMADFQTLDYQQGLNKIYQRGPAQEAYKYLFHLKGKETISKFKQFLGRCNGRRVPFFMPTWVSDMQVVQDIGSGGQSIVIAANGYDRYYANLPAVEGVFFEMADGESYARSIVGHTVSANGNIQLDIDSALGTAYTVSQIKKASYLVKCRFMSDLVKIKYLTTDMATVQTGMAWVDE